MSKSSYLMNGEWLFHRGEHQAENSKDINSVYYPSKSEVARGPAAYTFYDDDWMKVTLPHNYVVSGEAGENESSIQGYLSEKIGWYRKYFELCPEDEGMRIKILFEGVAANCTIWVNGYFIKRHFTGYEDFEVDISEIAIYGQAVNVVAVRVEAESYNNEENTAQGYWHGEAGIYKNVWLEKVSQVHVERYGLTAKTEFDQQQWKTEIQVIVINESMKDEKIEVDLSIINPEGQVEVWQNQLLNIAGEQKRKLLFDMQVDAPEIWSLETPNLYTARVEIKERGKRAQLEEIKYGYRTLRFNPNKGFLLNDKLLKLKGIYDYRDYGILGCEATDDSTVWRIRQLKEMGFNACRCSYNTVNVAFLDACDQEGMLVVSESCTPTTAEEDLNQLRRIIKRKQNHPSIIMWSIGNEEFEQYEKIDSSRPCTVIVSSVEGKDYKEIWEYVNSRPFVAGIFYKAGVEDSSKSKYLSPFLENERLDDKKFEKGYYYLVQILWKEEPMICIQLHWSWAEGKQKVEVWIYSNCESVELFLNNESLGEQIINSYQQVRWAVDFKPGILKAVGKIKGRVRCSEQLQTCNKPERISMIFINRKSGTDGEKIVMLSAVSQVPHYSEGKRVCLYFENITGEAEIWVRRKSCENYRDRNLERVERISISEQDERLPCSLKCPNPCEIYYKKVETKTLPVVLDLPKKLFKPDEAIKIWVEVKKDQREISITEFVRWMILEEKSVRGEIDEIS